MSAYLLLAGALAILCGQASCSATKNTYYHGLKYMNDVPPTELIEKLERPIMYSYIGPAHRGYKVSSRVRVAMLLASAAEKDTPNVLLGKYSVNDFLTLNSFSIDDCTKAEVSRRHRISREMFEGSESKDPEMSEKTKNIYGNLHNYCGRPVGSFLQFCSDERSVVADRAVKSLTRSDKSQIKSLQSKVAKAAGSTKELYTVRHYLSTLETVLTAMKPAELDKLVTACKAMTEKLQQLPKYQRENTVYTFDDRDGWLMAEEYCAKIVVGDPISGLAVDG